MVANAAWRCGDFACLLYRFRVGCWAMFLAFLATLGFLLFLGFQGSNGS